MITTNVDPAGLGKNRRNLAGRSADGNGMQGKEANPTRDAGGATIVAAPPGESASTREAVIEPAPAATPRKTHRRRTWLLLAGGVLVVGGLVWGGRYWLWSRHHEETDDAFVQADVINVSPQVAGRVQRLYVDDNQLVHQGDPLLDIDPRDYQARLAQAEAALASATAQARSAGATAQLTETTAPATEQQATAAVTSARAAATRAQAQQAMAGATVEQAKAQVAAAEAAVAQARAQNAADDADLERAANDLKRTQQLFNTHDVGQQELEHAVADERVAHGHADASAKAIAAAESQVSAAKAARASAEQSVASARAAVSEAEGAVAEAQARLKGESVSAQRIDVAKAAAAQAAADVEKARADVETAELNLAYTRLTAPRTGYVTSRSVVAGNYVQPGQSLLAIVPQDAWVVGNFKETQLTRMKEGDEAEVTIDAYPGEVLKGHVASLQRGSGAQFSLLPPENATGNYVKVVQRVPVKIVFDHPEGFGHIFAPGMSAVPVVTVR